MSTSTSDSERESTARAWNTDPADDDADAEPFPVVKDLFLVVKETGTCDEHRECVVAAFDSMDCASRAVRYLQHRARLHSKLRAIRNEAGYHEGWIYSVQPVLVGAPIGEDELDRRTSAATERYAPLLSEAEVARAELIEEYRLNSERAERDRRENLHRQVTEFLNWWEGPGADASETVRRETFMEVRSSLKQLVAKTLDARATAWCIANVTSMATADLELKRADDATRPQWTQDAGIWGAARMPRRDGDAENPDAGTWRW